MEKVESVNFTSSMEKYTWSLADTIKYGAMMLGSLVLLSISSWESALASVAILATVYFCLNLFLGKIVSARRKLEQYSKNIVQASKNIASKSFFFSKEFTQREIKTEIEETLYNYTRYRMRITYYRSLVSIISAVYASILIISGILLLANSRTLGLLFITMWFFSKDSLERLIDAYIVNLSESIHTEHIYYSDKPRQPIIKVDSNALEKLKKDNVSILICGPNGSGKSVLVREIYFLSPDDTKYYDSRFSLNRKSLNEMLQNMRNGETIIFDESIYSDSYPWLFEYLDQHYEILKSNNNNIIVVAHGIDIHSLSNSIKTLYIQNIINLLSK